MEQEIPSAAVRPADRMTLAYPELEAQRREAIVNLSLNFLERINPHLIKKEVSIEGKFDRIKDILTDHGRVDILGSSEEEVYTHLSKNGNLKEMAGIQEALSIAWFYHLNPD